MFVAPLWGLGALDLDRLENRLKLRDIMSIGPRDDE
jgi:hypothetical protein